MLSVTFPTAITFMWLALTPLGAHLSAVESSNIPCSLLRTRPGGIRGARLRNAGGVRASQKVRFAGGRHLAASSSDLTSLSWVSTARSSPTSMANDLLLAGDQGHAPIFQASPRATMWS